MSKSENYGSKQWAITGKGDTLFLMADKLEVLSCGALVAWGGYRKDGCTETTEPILVYGIAAKQWETFYAASCLDGRMVASDDGS